MKNLKSEKDALRQKIDSLKKQYAVDDLALKSEEVMSVIEITGVFQEAKTILIYSSMNGEVVTMNFIKKWKNEKDFYLPVTLKDEIVFRKYTTDADLKKSVFGILEPTGDDFTDYNKVDLVIVPGVAFDRKMNRMGYGKGYYDKFLPKVKAPKMGICFDFQLLNDIPAGDNDIKMNYLISENDLIW